MRITVIVCTYNRCRTLAAALQSIADQVLPNLIDWEVLVVDNNSGDETREVVEEFCRRYPGRFHYIFEAEQGLSSARNAGIRESKGEILAFTDDDVTVSPAWLESLTSSLHTGDWAGAGGRILPVWSSPPPRWFPRNDPYTLGPLAVFDRGAEPCQLRESPVGANMAFRKHMFQKYGGFRTDLGRRGGNLLSAEESEFSSRLLAQGERLRYEPSAVVRHPVSKNRLTKDYFLSWWFSKARSDIRAFGVLPEWRWRIAGVPLVLVRRLAAWTVRWLVAIERSRRFSCKLNTWAVAGQIVESRRVSHDTGQKKTDVQAAPCVSRARS